MKTGTHQPQKHLDLTDDHGGRETAVLSKKCVFILCALLFSAALMAGPVGADEAASNSQWKQWIGKEVHVTYACCGEGACVVIRGARLKEVGEKHIVVMTKGAPLFLPNYMVKALTLSDASSPHSAISSHQK